MAEVEHVAGCAAPLVQADAEEYEAALQAREDEGAAAALDPGFDQLTDEVPGDRGGAGEHAQ